MSDATAKFDLHRRDLVPARRTATPPYLPGAVDPLLTRKPNTMSPGTLVVTAMIVVALCASGDGLYQLCQKYNDQIVAAIIDVAPYLGGAALLLFVRVAVLWRRNERRLIAYERSMRQSSNQLVKDFQAESGVRRISRAGFQQSSQAFQQVAFAPKKPVRAEDLDPGLRLLPRNRTVPKIQRRRVQLPDQAQTA